VAGEEELLLQSVGLTRNEALVYLALASLGPSGASAIAEKSGVQRTLVYDTLKRLLEKGLVGQVDVDKKKLFQAVPPSRFKAVMEEREKQALDNVARVLPMLESTYRKGERPTASVYTGVEGLKAILTDEIESTHQSSEICAYRAQPEIASMIQVFTSWWHKKRVAKRIRFNAIMDATPAAKERGKQLSKLALTEVRYLETALPAPVTYHIFGDKVALLSVAKEEILGVVIESKVFAEFFKQDFERTWAALKQHGATAKR